MGVSEQPFLANHSILLLSPQMPVSVSEQPFLVLLAQEVSSAVTLTRDAPDFPSPESFRVFRVFRGPNVTLLDSGQRRAVRLTGTPMSRFTTEDTEHTELRICREGNEKTGSVPFISYFLKRPRTSVSLGGKRLRRLRVECEKAVFFECTVIRIAAVFLEDDNETT